MKEEVTIKSAEEIVTMRKAGYIAALVLDTLKKELKPGMSTYEIDQIAEKTILDNGATPSFKGFGGFPAATCISVNEEIVHGIPSKGRIVREGDIVGIDVGAYYQGFHSDTAVTLAVGQISQDKQKLLDVTKKSLIEAIKLIKPGIHLGDIQETIQKIIETEGYGVIRDLTGHGVGRQLQEPPQIPNYGKKGTGLILKEGMTIAVEPMVSIGTWQVRVKSNGWTIVTADGSPSAHFEHTIAITKNGAQVLTKI
ncbi:TPA: type I methionyl aminopeptidase [Candidatus Berkelbacteria bacterium]|uniref:Methionine aminopeptidase n=1 Tax=Berkelbacteria bacterium GW2011_GWE1_39_12 TaxID=1618337 RepID=A0A0G4B5S1_9BACT|nr:MAG: methionine aminopeptidase, methionyl aminopeptidase [Berkelbacteria bacterium GW2011_GWE1_39_12]HBO60177.1 type I methionyl aminopeptidase [Candidatus Berkelbacteria bacterium]